MYENLVESSMNFDAEDVRPFLEHVSSFIENGFGKPEVEAADKMVQSTRHDDERQMEFNITHQGIKSKFVVGVFMDDIDSPDLCFFGPPKLAEQIDELMDELGEEMG